MTLKNDILQLKMPIKEINKDIDLFVSFTNNEKTFTVSTFVNRFEQVKD